MPSQLSRARRLVAASLATLITAGALVVVSASAAQAVAVGVSIQATNSTTQKSGSEFDYQINLACSGTNAPTCKNSVLHIPLTDNNIPASAAPMDGWAFDVSGGPTGFIQEFHVDTATHELIVTLAGSIPAGSSQSVILKLTPPNRTTYNGTTWSLLPSITSTDPEMNGTTAPVAATGTATATVPLTVAKSAPQTFYREGDTFDYTLTATCPATPPVGSIDAAALTVTDTVPAGLHIVSATPADATISGQTVTWTYSDPTAVPTPCGGTAGTATTSTRTIRVQVGSVGAGAGNEIAPKSKLTNTVAATADPVGGGAPVTSTASRDIVVLGAGDDPFPGNASMSKTAAGLLNISATSTADFSGTYPGRWLPAGDNTGRPASVTEAAPASYTVTARTDNNGFEYAIVDPVPCLTARTGVTYSSLPAGGTVCTAPAFHVLGITVQFGGANPTTGFVPQYRDTVTGDLHDMVAQTGNGWVIPTGAIGQVAEIDVPRWATQQPNTNTVQVRVLGYADPSVTNGDILTNTGTTTWYIPATGAVAATATRSADLHILSESQIGVTKTMADVGGVTGNQASLNLRATLTVPSAATHDLVLSDLLPVGSILVGAPSAISGTLSWSGTPASPTTPALQVEVVPNYTGSQELVRIVLPAAQIPHEAGVFTLTIGQLRVTKPAAPGVYTNTARVFYDDPELSTHCSAGQYQSLDPQNSRDDPASSPVNCSADATFRTATSASGQFSLVKTVQGDYDTAPQQFPNVAHVKLSSGTAVYAIHWTNTGAPNLNGVVLYDILPFVGDTGVSGAQATEQRGSQFTPTLASVDAAPAGTTIAYSASTNPCRPEVYPSQSSGCVNDWTPDPTSLGGIGVVTALRMISTAQYATGDSIDIGFRESVPTVSKDQIAWNSVAAFAQTTTGAALLPAESPKVGITASDHRLSVGKTANVTSAGFGDLVHYTITVHNIGTATSDPTTASDQLPPGLDFVSADHGGTYEPTTRTLTWTVPALARGTSADFLLTARIDAEQTRSTITNTATVTNPPGYSSPIATDPCPSDPTAACADIAVPITNRGLALTGTTITAATILAPLVAIIVGLMLILWRRRRTTTQSN